MNLSRAHTDFVKSRIEHEIEVLLFDAAIQITNDERRRQFLESACSAAPDRLAKLSKLVGSRDQAEELFAELIDARDHMVAEFVADSPDSVDRFTSRRTS